MASESVLLVGLTGRFVVVVGSSRSSKYPTAIVSAGNSVDKTCLFEDSLIFEMSAAYKS